jgi:HAD superfamily hydrolase (TIGR01549 family)
MNIVKLVVFDLDGTLVDSDKTVIRILNTIRKDLNLPSLYQKDVHLLLSLGGEEMIKKVIEREGDVEKYLKIFRKRYIEDPLINEKTFDGAINYLNYLKSKNIQMAIFTNKPKNLTIKTLKRHQIDNFFKYIVTGDDVILKKPDLEGLEKLIKISSISPKNIIMIGDSIFDFKVANLLSIPFFYHDVSSNQEIVNSKKVKIFNNFNDLID